MTKRAVFLLSIVNAMSFLSSEYRRKMASERLEARVPRIDAAEAHAAVTTLVQERDDRPVLLPHDHHGILAHVCREEVAGLRDLTRVREEEPTPAEHALELESVELLVAVDPRVDRPGFEIDQ
jgi:hypothetical protein